jgi:transposase
MMPADPTRLIAALGVERTYSAREAAALLGRSYSWIDQRVRAGQFTNPDGSVLQPLRTPGGYRRFRQSTLRDIALCCYRHRWFTMDALKLVLRELAIAAYRDTGEYKIPSGAPSCGQLTAVPIPWFNSATQRGCRHRRNHAPW